MKKLTLLFISTVLLFACSGKEQADPVTSQSACTINGNDCWEIVKLLAKTKITPTKEAYTYENPALEKLGLTVTAYDMYQDGGSTFFILNNEVFVYTNRKLGTPREQIGAVTIRFKKDPTSASPEFDGPLFEYTPKGRLKNK